MKVYLATGNRHKVREVRQIMSAFGIDVIQLKIEKEEHAGMGLKETARRNAKIFAETTGRPVMVDDTGVFFSAYPGFPGSNPKMVYDGIGYDGIFRLLRGKDRSARFETVVGFARPNKKAVTFKGVLRGRIATNVYDKYKDVLPYERIFIPAGQKKTTSQMSRDEKNSISHRARAFRKLGEHLR